MFLHPARDCLACQGRPAPDPSHTPPSDTPVKVHLRRKVGEYKEALQQSHIRAAEEIREYSVDAASKVNSLLKNQRGGFEQAANECKEVGRAVAAREVAEERAKIHAEATDALRSRELQIQHENEQLLLVKEQLSQARKDLLYETSYRDQVCKEADAAIRKNQTDAEQSAQSTLTQHRGQAEHMVQTLQGQI